MLKILNKKAKFKYNLLEELEAGIQLIGGEIKSIRVGSVDLGNAYVKIIGSEAYLVNANIPTTDIKDSTRSRKLLLHKNEIISLKSKIKAKKLTVVPVSMYTKGRLIKIKLALAKTKKQFEKKEAIKKRDLQREIEREIKTH